MSSHPSVSEEDWSRTSCGDQSLQAWRADCNILVLRTSHQASLVAQIVKNLPAMQETWLQSLGWEDPLEEGMANHSSILAWRIPWTEESDGLQSMGNKELDMTEQLPHTDTHTHTHTHTHIYITY